MNGHVLEELPIAVDCFKDTRPQLYFLTHAHSDHTVGLNKSWRTAKIYCTEITAKLASHRLGVRHSWFEELELQQEYFFKLRSKEDWLILTVTVLPANHCPGSCMFVFETESAKILYTGDFKPNDKLYDLGRNIWGPTNRMIDVMYVDNTYAEQACVLPPQDVAINEIIQLCKDHNDCTIFIGIYWTGHEELLSTISSKLDQLIVVKPEQLAVLELVGNTVGFTTDKFASDLHAIPMHQITSRYMSEINETEKSIAIIPTGRLCDRSHKVTEDGFTFSVPFSHHPSYSELKKFLEITKPAVIKPIVEGKEICHGMGSLLRADMSQFQPQTSKHFAQNTQRVSRETEKREMGAYNAGKQQAGKPASRRLKKARSCKPVGVVFED